MMLNIVHSTGQSPTTRVIRGSYTLIVPRFRAPTLCAFHLQSHLSLQSKMLPPRTRKSRCKVPATVILREQGGEATSTFIQVLGISLLAGEPRGGRVSSQIHLCHTVHKTSGCAAVRGRGIWCKDDSSSVFQIRKVTRPRPEVG